jgi:hypothetical protein
MPNMGSTRRSILAAGAAAAATTALPRVFGQQSGTAGTGKFYERGPVRVYDEEAGSGFPLLLLPGGGLNSTSRDPDSPLSAKGAARTIRPARNCFAPHSVLREFLKSVLSATRSNTSAPNITANKKIIAIPWKLFGALRIVCMSLVDDQF